MNLRPGLILTSALALGMIPFAQADQWDKKTIITIDQPIQVTNTYLEPGTYVLKLLNSSSDRHIVQIYNRDQNHLIDTVMAMNNYHLVPHGRTQFTFWETPPGTAKAMRAWFYPGDNYGQEFRYPTELRQIALATAAPAPRPVIVEEQKSAVVEERKEEAVVTPEPAPAPAAAPEEPQQLAQNVPPPAPEPQAAPAPEPTPAPAPPQELPKTASPYPLFGLAGLLSVGLYSLLRVKRLS